jgi:outer membrane protein OmpA-like peptidoglycan-associated protein
MITLLLLSLATPSARAAETEFDFGVYGGYFVSFATDSAPSSPTWGAHGTVQWGGNWGAELALGRLVGPYDDVAGGRVGGAFDPRVEVQHYFANMTHRVRPFAGLGLGVYTQNDRFSPFVDVGPSLEINVLPILDLRGDVRLRLIGGSEKLDETFAPGLLLDLGLQIHNPRISDTDGDGINDDVDACVDQPEDVDGFNDTDGCPDPDNDNDGIVDTADQCPDLNEDVDGFMDTDGCPDTDNDSDGIPDQVDACRDQAEDKDGFEDTDGCPDNDNDKDGVPDTSDKCPAEPETMNGYRDRDGCPDDVPEEVKRFSGKIEGIHFETGKAIIRPDSNKLLDQAVAVFQQYPDVRLEIQGHTDDVGDDAMNLQLSQDRAQAVVNYFIQKGVPADRFVAKGYGETKPMVANDTDAHRAENRRVEFVLIP